VNRVGIFQADAGFALQLEADHLVVQMPNLQSRRPININNVLNRGEELRRLFANFHQIELDEKVVEISTMSYGRSCELSSKSWICLRQLLKYQPISGSYIGIVPIFWRWHALGEYSQVLFAGDRSCSSISLKDAVRQSVVA
jgi:hypothetical protein